MNNVYQVNDKVMSGKQLCDSLWYVRNRAGVQVAVDLYKYKGVKVVRLKRKRIKRTRVRR